MDERQGWAPVLIGVLTFGMGAYIVGAVMGIVPYDEAHFLAPRYIIAAAGSVFMIGGMLAALPGEEMSFPRSILVLAMVAAIAVTVHWAAFSPQAGEEASTSISLGPVSFSGGGAIGQRICFGLIAMILDGVILFMIASWIRKRMSGD